MKKKLYVAPCARVVNVKSEGSIAAASEGGTGENNPSGWGSKEDVDMEEEW